MRVYPDTNITLSGGRIATMRVTYARLVEVFGEPNVPAERLDPDKVTTEWLLATSEGPVRVYNWLPETNYQAPEQTTRWHIGGTRSEVVACAAQALNVSARIHWYDPVQRRIVASTVEPSEGGPTAN